MKDRFGDILWKMLITRNGRNGMDSVKTLQDEVILYCAMDVEPLHEIQSTLSSLISPSYLPLVSQLSELEVLRAIDPELVKLKRRNLKTMEMAGLFLQGHSCELTAPDIYSALLPLEGQKQIYLSPLHNTANVILDLRGTALQAVNTLGKSLGCSVRLTVPAEPTELAGFTPRPPGSVQGEAEEDEGVNNRQAEQYMDPQACYGLVQKIIKAEIPVVVDFHLYPGCVSAGIFYGVGMEQKVILSEPIIKDGGLGLLMSSSSTKIIFRLDVSGVQAALKMFESHGFKVSNIFDIDCAAKLLDYGQYGTSLFKAHSRNIQKICSLLGLPLEGPASSSKLGWYYLAYLQLFKILPQDIVKILNEKTSLEVEIGSSKNPVELKEKRRKLRQKYEVTCVHIRITGGKKVKKSERTILRKVILTILLKRDITLREYLDLENCALIYLPRKQDTKYLIEDLENSGEPLPFTVTVTSPDIDQPCVENSPPTSVDMEDLEDIRHKFIAKINSVEL